MTSPRTIDVLVLGGGPAGAAAARRLASAGAAVAIVERSGYDRFRVGETLPPNAVPLFAEFGATAVLEGQGHLPSPGTVAVWGSEEPYENDFIFSPYGQGWHLDRRRFDEALADEAMRAGAEVIREAHILDCASGPNAWTVHLQTKEGFLEVRTRRLVDATGRAAWLGQRRGAVRISYDRMVGIVGTFRFASDDPRTYIETRPTGWWYSSLLPGNRGIAVFFTDIDLHDLSPAGRRSLWSDELRHSRQTQERLGAIREDVDPHVVPASSSFLSRLDGDTWLAVGDAACTIDPLSSQGICWAIMSGLEAAEAILDPDPDCAAQRYAAAVAQRFQEYLDTRRHYYAAERRWPDSPFWRRRASPPATTPLTRTRTNLEV